MKEKTLILAVLLMPVCAFSALQGDLIGQWQAAIICCGEAGVPISLWYKDILIATKDSVYEYRNDTITNAQTQDAFIAFWTSGGRGLYVRNDSLFKDTVVQCCDIPSDWVYVRTNAEVKYYPSFSKGKKQSGKEVYFDISGRSIQPQFLIRNHVYIAKSTSSGLKRIFIKVK